MIAHVLSVVWPQDARADDKRSSSASQCRASTGFMVPFPSGFLSDLQRRTKPCSTTRGSGHRCVHERTTTQPLRNYGDSELLRAWHGSHAVRQVWLGSACAAEFGLHPREAVFEHPEQGADSLISLATAPEAAALRRVRVASVGRRLRRRKPWIRSSF